MSTTTSLLSSNVALAYARSLANTSVLVIGDVTHSGPAEDSIDSNHDVSQILDTAVNGEVVLPTDIAVSANRVDWVSGTVFTQYNAYAPDYCFVCTVVGSTLRVYKCLSNNKGAASTVKPTGTATSPITTSDDYVWQYMWTISAPLVTKFATVTTVPVIYNANVASSAVPQSITNVVVNDGGRGYTNFYSGIIQSNDVTSDLTIHLPADASSLNDIYNNCIIQVTNLSSGSYGEYRSITDYNGGTKTITLNAKFSALAINDTYEIRPQVVIAGSRTGNNAIASAVVANTSVTDVIVHYSGSNYVDIQTGVFADPAVNIITTANVVSQPAPVYGHGGNIFAETNASSVTISKTFANTSTTTNAISTFASVALISNPLVNGVKITGVANNMQRFQVGETIIGYHNNGPALGTVNASSSTLSGAGQSFDTTLAVGSVVTVANATHTQFVTVTGVTNSTVATISNNSLPIVGQATVVSVRTLGKMKSANSTVLTLTGSPLQVDSTIKSIGGLTSHASDTITTIDYNNTNLSYASTIGGSVTGSPVVGEVMIGNNQAIYVVGKTANSVTGYGSDVLTAGTTLTGLASNASITVSSVTPPSLVKNSGDVVYFNNMTSINIANNKTISALITLSF